MDFLRLFRSRRPAGADGPDGLVGDDGFAERCDAGGFQHRGDLSLDRLPRLPRLALLERFADAQDRQETGLLRDLELRRDHGVALAI